MPTNATATSRRKRLRLRLQVGAGAARTPTSTQIRRWADAALDRPGDITVRVVGAAEARRLNLRFRGEDHATNVLSFPYALSSRMVQGDIVLCAPVIAREARSQGKTLEAHYAHMTVHATLHLRGYDHAQRKAAERMEALERKVLAKLGYPDPYERTP
jgi:probable rRNA maturation factor